jgi:hypothetical protein
VDGEQIAARIGPRNNVTGRHAKGTDRDNPLGHSGRIALRRKQCNMLSQMPSLIGNGKLNTSMEALDSPTISDGCMTTKNGRPQK